MSLPVFLGFLGEVLTTPGWPLVSFGDLFWRLGPFRKSRERSWRVPGLPRGPRDVSRDAREGASRCLSGLWMGPAGPLGVPGWLRVRFWTAHGRFENHINFMYFEGVLTLSDLLACVFGASVFFIHTWGTFR